jgi:hypothetical protein
MRETDFLCDFCRRDWTQAAPFVEGHHGACICGSCLSQACAQDQTPSSAFRCSLCLEERQDLAWSHDQAHLCRRCREQSARVLARDPASGWRR